MMIAISTYCERNVLLYTELLAQYFSLLLPYRDPNNNSYNNYREAIRGNFS